MGFNWAFKGLIKILEWELAARRRNFIILLCHFRADVGMSPRNWPRGLCPRRKRLSYVRHLVGLYSVTEYFLNTAYTTVTVICVREYFLNNAFTTITVISVTEFFLNTAYTTVTVISIR
jgi:hypothetical protein